MFGGDNHPTGEGVGGVDRYGFYHAKGYVTVQASFNVMFPVSWNLAWCGNRFRFRFG